MNYRVPEDATYIYLLNLSDYVWKVGISRNIVRRLTELRRGFPHVKVERLYLSWNGIAFHAENKVKRLNRGLERPWWRYEGSTESYLSRPDITPLEGRRGIEEIKKGDLRYAWPDPKPHCPDEFWT